MLLMMETNILGWTLSLFLHLVNYDEVEQRQQHPHIYDGCRITTEKRLILLHNQFSTFPTSVPPASIETRLNTLRKLFYGDGRHPE